MPETNALIEIWRKIIVGSDKSWVLFGNGTCVVLMDPETDLGAQAVALMKAWGPVHPGTPAGDFSVIELLEDPGWVVTSHHKDLLTYVSLEEIEDADPREVVVGLIGRAKRDQDARELRIIHIEDRRV